MIPIPQDIEVDSLRECKVTEVCYSLSDITIYFDETGYITICGYFTLIYGKQRHQYFKVAPVHTDYGLLMLLGKEVTEVFINSSRDGLTLEFDDGTLLELMGHKVYDSYTLHIKGREAVV